MSCSIGRIAFSVAKYANWPIGELSSVATGTIEAMAASIASRATVASEAMMTSDATVSAGATMATRAWKVKGA